LHRVNAGLNDEIPLGFFIAEKMAEAVRKHHLPDFLLRRCVSAGLCGRPPMLVADRLSLFDHRQWLRGVKPGFRSFSRFFGRPPRFLPVPSPFPPRPTVFLPRPTGFAWLENLAFVIQSAFLMPT
jgi:hypothetical protein